MSLLWDARHKWVNQFTYACFWCGHFHLLFNSDTPNVANRISVKKWWQTVIMMRRNCSEPFHLDFTYLLRYHLLFVCKEEHASHISSRKHAYIVLIPLNPLLIPYNWGLQGYTLIFIFLLKNIDCGYSLEPPRRGGSNEYPQSMFWAEIWKLPEFFIWKFSFLMVKFSIYLNRHVFVMFEWCKVTHKTAAM